MSRVVIEQRLLLRLPFLPTRFQVGRQDVAVDHLRPDVRGRAAFQVPRDEVPTLTQWELQRRVVEVPQLRGPLIVGEPRRTRRHGWDRHRRAVHRERRELEGEPGGRVEVAGLHGDVRVGRPRA